MIPWIKMRVNLLDDPRVRLVSKAIGCNAVSVTGGLYMLWSLANQYSTDGKLVGYDADDLDKKFGKPGFAAALASEDVGWLVIGPNYLIVPKFDEHNGEGAKARAQTLARVHAHRKRNGDSVTKALPDKSKSKSKNEEGTTSLPDEVGADGQKITPETVYRAYPKHVEPEPSKKSIAEAVRYLRKQGTPTPWAWLLGRVTLYGDARKALEVKYPGCERFVPACHRWMRKKRYEEDPAEWAKEVPGFAVGPDRRGSAGRNGTHGPPTPPGGGSITRKQVYGKVD